MFSISFAIGLSSYLLWAFFLKLFIKNKRKHKNKLLIASNRNVRYFKFGFGKNAGEKAVNQITTVKKNQDFKRIG